MRAWSRLTAFAGIAAVLMLLALASSLPAQGGVSGLIARGNQLLAAGAFAQAAATFERARRIAGDGCVDCQVGLARSYYGLEDYRAVITPAQAAIGGSEREATLAEMARLLEVSLWHEARNRPAVLQRSAGAFRKVLKVGGVGERTALAGLFHVQARLGRTGEILSLAEGRLAAGPVEKRGALCAANPKPLGPNPSPAFQAELNRGLAAFGWTGPYFVVDGVERPARISGAPPVYTEEARRRRISGVVILRGVVTAEGGVSGVEVLAGLPFGLSESAVQAYRGWTFQPATLGGAAVPVCQTLTINFQIQ